MVISSLSGSEFVAVKVFLYKYTPFFNYIGENTKSAQLSQSTGTTAPSADAVNALKAMTANVQSFLQKTQSVINSPDIKTVLNYQNGVVGLNSNTIADLLNKYAPIINNLNKGGYIFTTNSLLQDQGVSNSLNSLNGGTVVGQNTQPVAITTLVLSSLSQSTASVPASLSNYLAIPKQQTVTTSPEGFVTPTMGPWYPFLQQLFNNEGAPTVVQTYLVPIFKAWFDHAKTLNSYLTFVQNYLTTIAQTGTSSSSSNQAQVEEPFQIIQYQIELNASKYLSKFDITQFVKSYSFNQGLYGGEYNWTVALQDVIIPFAQLSSSSTTPTIRKTSKFYDQNGDLIVAAPGPSCRSSNTAAASAEDLITLMAQYESEDTYNVTFNQDVSVIQQAFLTRGMGGVPYQSTYQTQFQTDSTSDFGMPPPAIVNQPSGIRLSDLLQKYNFISVFVYKSSVSFENAQAALFPNGVPTSVATQDASGTFNEPFDDSNEVHLMLAGFKNEFNGFIVNKSKSQSQGQVDQVTVEGNGILRLFSDTMTLYDPASVAAGYYGAAVLNLVTVNASDPTTPNQSISNFNTVFENKFQGLNPVQIVCQILKLVYGVDFTSVITGNFTSSHEIVNELQGFYNFYNLEVRQGTPIIPAFTLPTGTQTASNGNLFAMAPFLLACTMALRNYNYNLNSQFAGISTTNQTGIQFRVQGPTQNSQPDTVFTQINPKNLVSSQFAEEFGGPMAQIFFETSAFIPYFAMTRQSWDQWVTKFKTPHDILDEVCKNSFLEFYERPNGRIIFRTPQYNQYSRIKLDGSIDSVGNLLQSSNFNIITANYSEDSSQIKTLRRGSYRSQFLPPDAIKYIMPSYGNGKLMAQYGFREGIVEPNPILSPNNFGAQTTQGINSSTSNLNIQDLLSKYVRFILEYENAELRIGHLSLDGDPSLEVGKLFYDAKNNKIGYIIGVKKDLSVGQTYTASIQLKFVRDCQLFASGNSISANFRQLPTLEELVTSTGTFQLGAASTPVIEFNAVPAPIANNTTLQSINAQLIQGLGTGPFIGGVGTSSI
jgi:hypothetical protein